MWTKKIRVNYFLIANLFMKFQKCNLFFCNGRKGIHTYTHTHIYIRTSSKLGHKMHISAVTVNDIGHNHNFKG